MKTSHFKLLILLVAIPSLVSCDCIQEEKKSSPNSCDTYLICDNDEFIELECSPGLHFNPTENTCDWPENAGCDVPPTECEPEELKPSPNSCSNYLKCDNGVFAELQCSPGLYFNPTENVCDWAENVGCEKDTEVPSAECEPEELKPSPNSCSNYLKCDNGVFAELQCPPGLNFNPTENVCDWAENAGCGNDTEVPSAECQPEELKPSPNSCSNYLKCDNGVFAELQCPPGLNFNPTENVCDWAENAGCGNDTEVPAAECQPEELKPSPNSCGNYLQCDNGVFIELQCSPGLLFSPTENTCDWPKNVECKL